MTKLNYRNSVPEHSHFDGAILPLPPAWTPNAFLAHRVQSKLRCPASSNDLVSYDRARLWTGSPSFEAPTGPASTDTATASGPGEASNEQVSYEPRGNRWFAALRALRLPPLRGPVFLPAGPAFA